MYANCNIFSVIGAVLFSDLSRSPWFWSQAYTSARSPNHSQVDASFDDCTIVPPASCDITFRGFLINSGCWIPPKALSSLTKSSHNHDHRMAIETSKWHKWLYMSPSSNSNFWCPHERKGSNGYSANPPANAVESIVFCYTYRTICTVQKGWIGVIDGNPVLTPRLNPQHLDHGLHYHHKDHLICKLVKQKLAFFTKIYCKVWYL
jgi:hypothetical protein